MLSSHVELWKRWRAYMYKVKMHRAFRTWNLYEERGIWHSLENPQNVSWGFIMYRCGYIEYWR